MGLRVCGVLTWRPLSWKEEIGAALSPTLELAHAMSPCGGGTTQQAMSDHVSPTGNCAPAPPVFCVRVGRIYRLVDRLPVERQLSSSQGICQRCQMWNHIVPWNDWTVTQVAVGWVCVLVIVQMLTSASI